MFCCWSVKKDRRTSEEEKKKQGTKSTTIIIIPDSSKQLNQVPDQVQSPHIIHRNLYTHNEEQVILNVRKPFSEKQKSERYSQIRLEEIKERTIALKNLQGKDGSNQYYINQQGIRIRRTESQDYEPAQNSRKQKSDNYSHTSVVGKNQND